MSTSEQKSPPKIIWWALWSAIAGGLLAIHAIIPVVAAEPTPSPLKHLPMIPLLASSALRWIVLPRITEGFRALPLFIVGLVLAEGGSLLGLFLVPDLRQTYLVLGVAGVAQYVPFFISRYMRV
jgi:hypothetical protein